MASIKDEVFNLVSDKEDKRLLIKIASRKQLILIKDFLICNGICRRVRINYNNYKRHTVLCLYIDPNNTSELRITHERDSFYSSNGYKKPISIADFFGMFGTTYIKL